MEQKEVTKIMHICTIFDNIEYDKFLQKLTEARESILKNYPEANDLDLEFIYHNSICEIDVALYYKRLETPDEMHQRLQSETIAKNIKLAQIHNFVDANKEEILKYLNKQ